MPIEQRLPVPPNSTANPLPSRVLATKIPLSADAPNRLQTIDPQSFFAKKRRFFGRQNAIFR
jgi:hypothetical protein